MLSMWILRFCWQHALIYCDVVRCGMNFSPSVSTATSLPLTASFVKLKRVVCLTPVMLAVSNGGSVTGVGSFVARANFLSDNTLRGCWRSVVEYVNRYQCEMAACVTVNSYLDIGTVWWTNCRQSPGCGPVVTDFRLRSKPAHLIYVLWFCECWIGSQQQPWNNNFQCWWCSLKIAASQKPHFYFSCREFEGVFLLSVRLASVSHGVKRDITSILQMHVISIVYRLFNKLISKGRAINYGFREYTPTNARYSHETSKRQITIFGLE